MRPDELIGFLAMIFVLGIPSLSLAAHFVLRPMVRDIVQALGRGKEAPDPAFAARLERLEERLDRIGELTERLAEAERFRRELEAGRSRQIEAARAAGDPPPGRPS